MACWLDFILRDVYVALTVRKKRLDPYVKSSCHLPPTSPLSYLFHISPHLSLSYQSLSRTVVGGERGGSHRASPRIRGLCCIGATRTSSCVASWIPWRITISSFFVHNCWNRSHRSSAPLAPGATAGASHNGGWVEGMGWYGLGQCGIEVNVIGVLVP